MVTAETRATAARLHSQASDVLGGNTLRVPARDLVNLIEALWSETERADVRQRRASLAAAEDRMTMLFGPAPGPYPSL